MFGTSHQCVIFSLSFSLDPSLISSLTEGGLFFIFGLMTFCRFLGAWAQYGWAWNAVPIDPITRQPKRIISAEMVESAVIFTYGITNTWMERFGAHQGDPYTTKQIQHIGIAVMFWFAGLVGMALESRRVRRWLTTPVRVLDVSSTYYQHDEHEREKVSKIDALRYICSYNPFPAIVIGVTGAAMSAHHQDYLFAVQVHALWGNLLVTFAVLRCLTYAFLWINPPRGGLPSRPPTEALASFFVACGGLVFIASTEQVVFAAMRHGRGG